MTHVIAIYMLCCCGTALYLAHGPDRNICRMPEFRVATIIAVLAWPVFWGIQGAQTLLARRWSFRL